MVAMRCQLFLSWKKFIKKLNFIFFLYLTFIFILSSKIINDCETGRSRDFGFVTFASEQSMRDAIEGMNYQTLDGRNITVNEAQSRGSGGSGGGCSGGGRGYGGRGGYGGGGGYGDGRNRGFGGGGGGDGGSRYSRGGGGSDGYWRNE